MSEDLLLEESQDPKDEEIPDEETREILEEMKGEGDEVPALGDKPAKEEVKEEEEEEEKRKEQAEIEAAEKAIKEAEVKEEEKPNRLPKMMPAFKHKIAEKEWSKKETALLSEIETLKNKPNETPAQEAKATEDIDTKIEKLAEEKGVDAELIKQIVSLVPKQETSTEIQEAMKVINDLKASNEQVKADVNFQKEFKAIEPLIKAEYPDISDGDLSKVQQQLKDTAHSKEYATTPLSVIYKGLDGFREAVMTKKKSAESSRSGQNRSSEIQDYSNWTENDIEKASRDEVDKYFDWVDKNKAS